MEEASIMDFPSTALPSHSFVSSSLASCYQIKASYLFSVNLRGPSSRVV